MNELLLSPYAFMAVYMVVDIIYVSLSKPVYNSVIKSISGKEISVYKQGFWLYAFIAYASMVIAWLVLVVPSIYYMISRGIAKWKAGVITGIAYGLAVYGVFNGTLYTMFEKWDSAIAIRDMIWGISWSTIITILFAITRK